ncbi:MAG: tRNA (adenosine(37)-N6)-dimethylallyltransferase MiaA [Dehalococcoidia bacterium]|jgi:tRNA dimethylallyltransferase
MAETPADLSGPSINPRSRGFPASAADLTPAVDAATRPALIAVVGPTASGKSEIALRLALAFDGEIVSADSRQVYRFMDVGTAKPTPEERAAVRHWLIDVVNPDAEFSLTHYLDLARDALADIWYRRRTPFLVGGSGQYVWALLEGWQVPRVAPDVGLRRSLEERAEREGADALYRELLALNSTAAARVDARNVRRLVRAIELQRRSAGVASREKLQPEFQPLILAIDRPRAELYRRIDERVDRMLGAGLVEEVRSLLARGYDAGLPPMSGIGYRQVVRYLQGEMSLAEVAATMKTETHRVARMQSAWFRRDDPRIHWLDAAADPFEQASELVKERLAR